MSKPTNLKLVAALVAVAVVWGTTYLGIRVAVQTIPGWYVAGLRQIVASAILVCLLLYRKELKWIGWQNWRRQATLATLMIVIANGMTTVAEESIPSGLASLLTALSPIAVFLGSVATKMQKLSLKGILGVLLGFSGVAFIFRDGLGDLLDPNYKTGVCFIAIAILGWASGTLYAKKTAHKSDNIFLDLFYQFSFAAVVQLALANFIYPSVAVSQWSSVSMLAVIYLGVFGSIVGFVCYIYALKRVSAIQVSILSYVNTVIAIFLGWLVLDEIITFDFMIATALIILGVFITNYQKKVA